MTAVRAPRAPRSTERGAFGILYAVMLPVMLGMVGLAVDLSIVYARGHELQAIADGAALAAARALDGTAAGLETAKANARSTARRAEYRFLHSETIEWSSAALTVGATPEGPWVAADAVSATELPTMYYARVDTSALDAMYGKVGITFLKVVGVDGEYHLSRRAVAGRRDSAIAPLAICALDAAAESYRENVAAGGYDEYIEFGFRRGVGYNLLDLAPDSGSGVKHYSVNPLDFPPAPAVASHHTDSALRPFVCTGTVPAPAVLAGSQVYVREQFPSTLLTELNSRFADYTGGSVCTKFNAPPDANIIDFRGPYALHWMGATTTALRGSAKPHEANGRRATIADAEPSALPAVILPADYGPLWAFTRPLRFNRATGQAGAPFTRSDWNKLYPVTSGTLSSSYGKSQSPYDANASPHRLSPAPIYGIDQRRVLNVALLECPVSGSSARVLGIGRFLMTSPATASPAAIHAEFGGATSFGALAASAVLYK